MSSVPVDPVDFEVFVANSSPRLIRAAQLLLRDPDEAQDLVQEALVRVYFRWSRINEPQAAHAYAYKILIRLAKRHLGRSRFLHERRMAQPPELAVSPVADNLNNFDELQAALQTLPIGQRQVLVLRYFCDLSTEATAAAVGCSQGTVKSQTSKGLASLRNHFASSPSSTPAESAEHDYR